MAPRVIAHVGADAGHVSIELTPPDADLNTSQYRNVVVIPDVHGDAEAFLHSLYIALQRIDGDIGGTPDYATFKQVFDDAIAGRPLPHAPLSTAAPGSVALVQIGDLVDRGPYSIRCMDIIVNAERVLGWAVRILHGNHELQRLLARNAKVYMHKREIEEFASEEAAMAFMQTAVHERLDDVSLLMARLSAGGRDAMGIDNPRNPNTLFVHAGIHLDWFKTVTNATDVNEINAMFQKDMKDWDRLTMWNVAINSPVWMRQYDQLPDNDVLCGEFLTAVLAHFNVARIVVGHTPQFGGVRSKCNGQILLIDVRISRWMYGGSVDEASGNGGNPTAVIMAMGPDGGLDSINAHFSSLDGSRSSVQQIFPPSLDDDLVELDEII